jgi:hypothetical protein
MRGKWEKARGKVVESPDAVPGAAWPAFSGTREIHGYVVELQGPGGQVLRAPVEMPGIFVRAVGEPIAVEVNFKTGEIRIDRHGMAEILREQASSERAAARLTRPAQTDVPPRDDDFGGPSLWSPV